MQQVAITLTQLTIFFGSVITLLLGVIAFFLKLAIKDLIDVKKNVEHHTLQISLIKQNCKIVHSINQNNKNEQS